MCKFDTSRNITQSIIANKNTAQWDLHSISTTILFPYYSFSTLIQEGKDMCHQLTPLWLKCQNIKLCMHSGTNSTTPKVSLAIHYGVSITSAFSVARNEALDFLRKLALSWLEQTCVSQDACKDWWFDSKLREWSADALHLILKQRHKTSETTRCTGSV